MGATLKVYLLPVEPGGVAFYSEEPEPEVPDPAAPPPAEPGWFERRYRRVKAVFYESEGRFLRALRALWLWLQERTHPDEVLLGRLRGAEGVEVYHPAAMPADEAAAAWSAYLARGRRRHRLWFVVDLIVTPLTVVLGPLPGPNLICYWFAYRTFRHWVMLDGLKRVRAGALGVEFCPLEGLEPVLAAPVADAEVDRLAALGCTPVELSGFFERQGLRPKGG